MARKTIFFATKTIFFATKEICFEAKNIFFETKKISFGTKKSSLRWRPSSLRRRPWSRTLRRSCPGSNCELLTKPRRPTDLRVRAKISSHSGASAGRADARRRDAGDVVHRRGAATQQMPARRRAPKGCRLSELPISYSASCTCRKPESRQQNVKLFLREPLKGNPRLRAGLSAGFSKLWQSGLSA